MDTDVVLRASQDTWLNHDLKKFYENCDARWHTKNWKQDISDVEVYYYLLKFLL